LDKDGLIHYLGRKDYQVKLHGQRIELGEIERCLLDTSISACVVVKWGDDHLVAYVQSPDINVEQLLEHCQAHLPSFMVPSVFIMMERLPLNANGKLDRKRLPPPDLSVMSSTASDHQHREPRDEVEMHVHSIWCEILRCSRISTTASIFSVGGHSLLLIQLYHRYKTMFDFDTRAVDISQFFQHSTILDHARLISQSIKKQRPGEVRWLSLHVTQGLFDCRT
jgi:tyrocidine synthetase-3